MKTLAVLSALVGLSVAAPAPQNGLPPSAFNQHGSQALASSDGIGPIDFNAEINGPVISARSHHGFKNPVIVKKNNGYHLYRDSTEERADADPRENCGKQVRVKLCDDVSAKSADLKRSTKNDNKDDVEDSIKLAKEAVESLQRDLKNIEHDTSGKSAQWKHGEPDKDLHNDIEAAREALEHAQRKFGNLESMNLRAATIRDSEVLNNLGTAKTEEERRAQWKEAMENIQKNIEIARNIEDSFKAAEFHSSFMDPAPIDTTKLMRSDDHENKEKFHQAIWSEKSGRKAVDEISSKKMTETKLTEHHTISQKKAEDNFEHDMKTAASESAHMKHHHHEHDHKHHGHNHKHLSSKATQGKLADVSLNVKGLPLALKTDANVQLAKEKGLNVDASTRSAHTEDKISELHKSSASKITQSENNHEVSLNMDMDMSSRTSDAGHHSSAHKDESMKKHFESRQLHSNVHNMQEGKTAAKEWETGIDHTNSKHEKNAWEIENKDVLMKSAEHSVSVNDKTNLEQKSQTTENLVGPKFLMKSAEHSFDHKKHEDDAEQFVKKAGLSIHTDMKLADNVEQASDINLNGPINVQLNHGVELNSDTLKQGKAAEMKELGMEHEARVTFGKHGMGHHGHHEIGHHEHGHLDHMYHGHQMHGHQMHGHQMHGHGFLHGHGHHGHHGYHGKAADFDSVMHPSMNMETKEFAEKSAMDNMFQWKPHHDARSSYGLGPYGGGLNLAGGAGSGAVGVFPHAKVGGCGVPLLLSCSPSVVSGSLAKPHGYAAPAYRHTEETSFKNKRDIIKTKETPIKKSKDIMISTKPKDLEKKL